MASSLSVAAASGGGDAAVDSPMRARAYADVCNERPQTYSDYESMQIEWSRPDNYEVVRKIGMLIIIIYCLL